ncbi:hypothetical protein B0H14DRAFT_2964463 [Mycena olivaceomarginata]|nr:hypothetical protein B0H14DRAFT_2964463 [Mycena olivaceomarginata]
MALLISSLLLAAVAISGVAGSSSGDPRHQWIAPQEHGSAFALPGPQHVSGLKVCPTTGGACSFRSLANHGYLPRNGRDISIPMMLKAAIDGFNVGPDAILQAAKFGLLSGDDPTTLNLDALKLHNLIEHDASTIFSTLANANPGVDYYNATSAGRVQHDRLAISLATNPNITNTPKEFLLRAREAGLYLSVMGNPLTGVAPKK